MYTTKELNLEWQRWRLKKRNFFWLSNSTTKLLLRSYYVNETRKTLIFTNWTSWSLQHFHPEGGGGWSSSSLISGWAGHLDHTDDDVALMLVVMDVLHWIKVRSRGVSRISPDRNRYIRWTNNPSKFLWTYEIKIDDALTCGTAAVDRRRRVSRNLKLFQHREPPHMKPKRPF